MGGCVFLSKRVASSELHGISTQRVLLSVVLTPHGTWDAMLDVGECSRRLTRMYCVSLSEDLLLRRVTRGQLAGRRLWIRPRLSENVEGYGYYVLMAEAVQLPEELSGSSGMYKYPFFMNHRHWRTEPL